VSQNANNECGYSGCPSFSPNSQGQSIFTGANITINSNLAAPWYGGYPDTFDIGNINSAATQTIYQSVTLLHELGHWFNIVTGAGASSITTPDPGKLSPANSNQVYTECFSQM
jgi:hypothetical protein